MKDLQLLRGIYINMVIWEGQVKAIKVSLSEVGDRSPPLHQKCQAWPRRSGKGETKRLNLSASELRLKRQKASAVEDKTLKRKKRV